MVYFPGGIKIDDFPGEIDTYFFPKEIKTNKDDVLDDKALCDAYNPLLGFEPWATKSSSKGSS